MPTFINTINPTAFGFFDADTTFQTEADAIVTFVKRKLGDSTLSVELTSKDVWTCFEEATLEYGKFINENVIQSQLANVMGTSTASLGDMTNKYPRSTLEWLLRMAEPYATYAGTGGSHDTILGYIPITSGQQEYDIYDNLVYVNNTGSNVFAAQTSGTQTKLRLLEVYHYAPVPAQQQFLNASNVTNYLATEFQYESYVNSTVFYVLPVFEDILRRGMLESAYKVRRSHYTYEITGKKLRVFPIPNAGNAYFINKLYMRVAYAANPMDPAYDDQTLSGTVSGPHNITFTNLPYNTINAPGRQWIRQYTLALAKELLGLVRSKFDSVPIPDAELKLNGAELISQAREDKEKLKSELKDLLENLTAHKLAETEVNKAENLMKQLRMIPFRRPIIVG